MLIFAEATMAALWVTMRGRVSTQSCSLRCYSNLNIKTNTINKILRSRILWLIMTPIVSAIHISIQFVGLKHRKLQARITKGRCQTFYPPTPLCIPMTTQVWIGPYRLSPLTGHLDNFTQSCHLSVIIATDSSQ